MGSEFRSADMQTSRGYSGVESSVCGRLDVFGGLLFVRLRVSVECVEGLVVLGEDLIGTPWYLVDFRLTVSCCVRNDLGNER